MFTNPYLTSELARDRHNEMLARAEQLRLARRLVALNRASRQADRAGRRLQRALRKAARLRTQIQA
jgi:hypothetical protein